MEQVKKNEENSSQAVCLGEAAYPDSEPIVPPCEDWSNLAEKLAKEKEVVGIYISGHPLDDYKFEMQYFCNAKLDALKNLENYLNKNYSLVDHYKCSTSLLKRKRLGFIYVEGYDESFEFRIFGEEYLKFRHYLIQNNFIYIRLVERRLG